MNRKGFTLTELIVAIGILTMILSAIFTTYTTAHKLWRGGLTQITFQARGRITLARISENIRSSTGAAILNNGNRIRFVIDPNRTPGTTSDDVTCEYYISGIDIMYDPDISVAGNETSILCNVSKESSIPYFQNSGDLVVITFKLYNSDAIYGVHWSGMTTSIKMRNT